MGRLNQKLFAIIYSLFLLNSIQNGEKDITNQNVKALFCECCNSLCENCGNGIENEEEGQKEVLNEGEFLNKIKEDFLFKKYVDYNRMYDYVVSLIRKRDFDKVREIYHARNSLLNNYLKNFKDKVINAEEVKFTRKGCCAWCKKEKNGTEQKEVRGDSVGPTGYIICEDCFKKNVEQSTERNHIIVFPKYSFIEKKKLDEDEFIILKISCLALFIDDKDNLAICGDWDENSDNNDESNIENSSNISFDKIDFKTNYYENPEKKLYVSHYSSILKSYRNILEYYDKASKIFQDFQRAKDNKHNFYFLFSKKISISNKDIFVDKGTNLNYLFFNCFRDLHLLIASGKLYDVYYPYPDRALLGQNNIRYFFYPETINEIVENNDSFKGENSKNVTYSKFLDNFRSLGWIVDNFTRGNENVFKTSFYENGDFKLFIKDLWDELKNIS